MANPQTQRMSRTSPGDSVPQPPRRLPTGDTADCQSAARRSVAPTASRLYRGLAIRSPDDGSTARFHCGLPIADAADWSRKARRRIPGEWRLFCSGGRPACRRGRHLAARSNARVSAGNDNISTRPGRGVRRAGRPALRQAGCPPLQCLSRRAANITFPRPPAVVPSCARGGHGPTVQPPPCVISTHQRVKITQEMKRGNRRPDQGTPLSSREKWRRPVRRINGCPL